MPLDQLRIVREAAAAQRARPDSPFTMRRRDDAVHFAARHHTLEEIAAAAEMPPEVVDAVLSTGGAGGEEPESIGLGTRFRSSPA